MNHNKIQWICLVKNCDLIIEIAAIDINTLIELGEYHNIQHRDGYVSYVSDSVLKIARDFHQELHERDITIAKLKDKINKLSQFLDNDDDDN